MKILQGFAQNPARTRDKRARFPVTIRRRAGTEKILQFGIGGVGGGRQRLRGKINPSAAAGEKVVCGKWETAKDANHANGKRRRRDIFVEPPAKNVSSSVRSGICRPDGAGDFGCGRFYKDSAPTELWLRLTRDPAFDLLRNHAGHENNFVSAKWGFAGFPNRPNRKLVWLGTGLSTLKD